MRYWRRLGDGPLVFNLGHGITPETPIAHVEAMIAQVRSATAMSSVGPRHGGAQAMTRAIDCASPCSLALTALLFWLYPDNFYPWVKAIHVIAVISWMAGMLYLPRLFVYHCRGAGRLAAVGDLQGDGAPAAARHHQSGDDRHLGFRAVARLEGFWLPGRLAARQDRTRAC